MFSNMVAKMCISDSWGFFAGPALDYLSYPSFFNWLDLEPGPVCGLVMPWETMKSLLSASDPLSLCCSATACFCLSWAKLDSHCTAGSPWNSRVSTAVYLPTLENMGVPWSPLGFMKEVSTMTLMFYLFIPVTSGAPAAFSVSSFPVAGLLLLIFVFNIIYIEK